MSCPGQASEHDADHGQSDEGSDGAGVALEIACQAAIAADPGQGAFDDPALGQDDEFVQFVALDDLDHPTPGVGSRSRDAWPLTARREHIEDRVENFADVHLAPTPTALGRRDRRFDQRPLAVAQITRVAQTVAVGGTAVFRLPHSAPLSSDAGAREGITTDSSDSTTLWIGSKGGGARSAYRDAGRVFAALHADMVTNEQLMQQWASERARAIPARAAN